MANVQTGTVTFLPDGVTHRARDRESVLDVARRAGLYVETDCGGEGTCGKCALRVIGPLPAATSVEQRHLTPAQLDDGWRLSCQVQPAALDGLISVQLVHQLQSVKAGADLMAAPLALRPRIRRVAVQLDEPTLEDQRSDAARLVAALAARRFHARPTPAVLRALPRAARAAGGLVTATIAGGQIIGVEPGDRSRHGYGIAYDVGTTTVVGTLVDLVRGTEVATAAMLNPQVTHGADVISRINRSMNDPDGLQRLHEAALQAVASIAGRLAADAAVDLADVWELTFAGNTCMLHLLLGLDPRHLAPSPYVPAVTDAVSLTLGELWGETLFLPTASTKTTGNGRAEIGSPALVRAEPSPNGGGSDGHASGTGTLRPEALCYLLPGVASFVGADAVAVALATEIGERDEPTLAIDIGTNGEILLGSRHRLLACSAAAGPAFEGAHIRFGMRGTSGAIEHVRLVDGQVECDVIGGGTPRGICGSGLVDAVAELRRVGLVDVMGRLLPPDEARRVAGPRLAERVVHGPAGVEFILARGFDGNPPITLGQRDVRELQLAKGALRAGVELLLAELGVNAQDLHRIYLAGAFGSYVSAAAARAIGLIPPVPLQRVESVGNAAGRGSRMALASVEARRRAETLARRIEYLELSAHLGFTEQFMESMVFPELHDLCAAEVASGQPVQSDQRTRSNGMSI
ncbi:MAG: DUF4445 domain-containing protein [Chloroflexi bacterium]|nr:DUF4445 domain-containing protein [Chloroflexota bacterium]